MGEIFLYSDIISINTLSSFFRCHDSQSVLLTTLTSAACRVTGRSFDAGSVAPHPATMATVPSGTASSFSGRQIGLMCGSKATRRSSRMTATS